MASSRILLNSSTVGLLSADQPAGTPTHSEMEWVRTEQPAEYYRSAAARARSLAQDATTPRVKQHLREQIDGYDRLAGEVERASEKGARLANEQGSYDRLVKRVPVAGAAAPKLTVFR